MDMSSFCVSLWKRKLELDTQGDSGRQKNNPALPKGSQTSCSSFPLSSRQSWTEQPVDAILLLNLKTWQGKIGCPQVQRPKPEELQHLTEPLHSIPAVLATPFPVFHCHLAVKNYDQPYRAGIRREPSGSHGFEIDLSFMSKVALISSSLSCHLYVGPFVSTPSLISSLRWLLQPTALRWVRTSVRPHRILSRVQISSPHSAATLFRALPVTGLPAEQNFLDQVNMNTKTKSIIMLAKHHQSTSRNFHTHTLELYSLAPITPQET